MTGFDLPRGGRHGVTEPTSVEGINRIREAVRLKFRGFEHVHAQNADVFCVQDMSIAVIEAEVQTYLIAGTSISDIEQFCWGQYNETVRRMNKMAESRGSKARILEKGA